MSKRYPGNFITGNPVALSQTSNNGIWDLKDEYAATANNTWQEGDSGYYEIGKSLRCRYNSTGSLIKNSNLPTPTNSSKWTFSIWVKRNDLGNITNHYNSIFGKTVSAGANMAVYFGYSGSSTRDSITWSFSNTTSLETKQVFRDTNAWYHLVFVWDSANAIYSERAKIWVNGVQCTEFLNDQRSSISTSMDCWNTTNTGYVGAIGATSANSTTPNSSLDGSIAEVYNIDGQTLDPTYFGYFDSNGIWQPKPYTGTYGNAGGYFPFTENQSTYNLGRNFAGSNYFTYSEQFDNSAWSKYQSSVTANAAVAPDGTTTADKLVGTTGTTGDHQVSQSNMVTAVDNGTYTFSCYAKAAERSIFRLYIQKRDGATYAFSDFDLSTGQIYTLGGSPYAGAVPAITYVGNGWYRCSITVNVGTGAGGVSAIISYASPTAETAGYGLYIWGAQINWGTTTDRYIQTVTGAVNNDWTPYGLSLTAGSTYDSTVDSPTNVYTVTNDTGGVIPGNYCCWNPTSTYGGTVTNVNSSGWDLGSTSDGGSTSGNNTCVFGTIAVTTGKWYFETTKLNTTSNCQVPSFYTVNCIPGDNAGSLTSDKAVFGFIYTGSGNYIAAVRQNGSTTTLATYTSQAQGDVHAVALDLDNLTVTIYKNGTSAGTVSISAPSVPISVGLVQSSSWNYPGYALNTGQRPFAYTPPAGFKGICTTNLQATGTHVTGAGLTPNKFFDAFLYTGTSVVNKITTPSGFGPDMVWTKGRFGPVSSSNGLISDSVRGGHTALIPASTYGESSNGYRGLNSFDSNGFTWSDTGSGDGNTIGENYVAWTWKQSPKSGFNIVKFTQGASTTTVSHNLGTTPSMMILKSTSADNDWFVWHKSFANPVGDFLRLQNNAPTNTSYPTAWGAAPTNSSFSSSATLYTNGTSVIAYLWAEVPGFSKIGVYQGNQNADGPFVYCGFRPKFILIHDVNSNASVEWLMLDAARNQYNQSTYWNALAANRTVVENDGTYLYGSSSDNIIDFTANGFKIRATNGNMNYNYGSVSNQYIYMAFAESPFALNNRAR